MELLNCIDLMKFSASKNLNLLNQIFEGYIGQENLKTKVEYFGYYKSQLLSRIAELISEYSKES